MFRTFLPSRQPARLLSWGLAVSLAFPVVALLAGCGNNSGSTSAPPPTAPVSSAPLPSNMAPRTMGTQPAPPKQGMSRTKKAVIVLAGAALLYYLYKKHQAAQAAQAPQGSVAGGAQPQLYREEKGPNTGAIYYRDPQTHVPVWVTAPSQSIAVPADQVQQYAPDYQQYQGQAAPPAPANARTVSAMQYDPSLAQSGNPPGPGM